VNELTNLAVALRDAEATVTFRHHQVGYDIDFSTGQPRESPTALPDANVKVELIKVDGRWLVDSFANMP
jgi:hypothetical protein